MDTVIEHKGYRGVVAASGRVQILAAYTAQPLDSDARAAYRLQAYAEYLTLMASAAVDAVELQGGIIGIKPGSSSALRRRHGELIKAGMETARQAGKRIGRRRVTEREGFNRRFTVAAQRIRLGGLSLRNAALELDISVTTLRRLLRPDPN